MKQVSRWSVYFKERFPVVPNLLVAGGIVESARRLAPEESARLSVILSLIGGMMFLMQLRLMDELKDFEKDRVAHPDRPLPRGLFTPAEFSNLILRLELFMVAFGILCGFVLGWTAGGAFLIGTLYLHLMFKEFYVGERLASRPLLYAVTHQLILYPLGGYVLAAFGIPLGDPDAFWFCTMLLGAFFGFEVGRKLDPGAHPVLRTYLLQFGKSKTAFLLLSLLGIATYSADRIGLSSMLGPLFILLMGLSSLLWWSPSRFKIIEGVVTLFLLMALWAVPLRALFPGRAS